METYPYYCVCTSNNSQLSFFFPSSFLDWGSTCNLLLFFFMQNYSIAVSHQHAPASWSSFFFKPIFFPVILLCKKNWRIFYAMYQWITGLTDIFWKQFWYFFLYKCTIILWPMNMTIFWFSLTSFHLLKTVAIYLYLFPLFWCNFQGSLDW